MHSKVDQGDIDQIFKFHDPWGRGLPSCNNVALPYFTFGYLPRNIKILKIGDGYVIAARVFLHGSPPPTPTELYIVSGNQMTAKACGLLVFLMINTFIL